MIQHKTVQPSVNLYNVLDAQRLAHFNFRLNYAGKGILLRMSHDNDHVLYSRMGYQRFRNAEEKDVIDVLKREWEAICKMDIYDPMIAEDYSKFDSITPRSKYVYYKVEDDNGIKKHGGWLGVLAEYGKNYKKKIPSIIKRSLINILNEMLYSWVILEQRSIDEIVSDVTWLGHIKIGTNSGYPFNIAQDKDLALRTSSISLKIFKKWCAGEKINWFKLAFEESARTERKYKQRVISMASMYEKVIGAWINTVFDKLFDYFSIVMPRKYGSLDNLGNEFIKREVLNLCIMQKIFIILMHQYLWRFLEF